MSMPYSKKIHEQRLTNRTLRTNIKIIQAVAPFVSLSSLFSKGNEEPHLRLRAVAPQVGLQLPDALSISHEGEGVEVHAHPDAKVDVLPVLVSDGRQVGRLASNVEMPPAAHHAPVEYLNRATQNIRIRLLSS